MKALPIFSLAVALGACRSEPPEPTGRLDRPSGLAVVERPVVVDGETRVNREDLLIADSEAEGVKVLQYLGNGFNFVHAPVVFFPLVIPAPNFPTEIVVPMAQGVPVNHAYVLSTGDATLHVIDVSPLEFGGSPVEGDGNTHRRTIDLKTLGVGLIPTDIVVVHTAGDTDLIAVSFEGVSSEAALIMLRLNWMDVAPPADPSGQTPENGLREGEFVGSTSILRSPRGIAARGVGSANPSVLLSSSTSSVTEVSLDPLADNVVRGSVVIDVSGPTEDVLDAGPQGAFAIRSDRSRVVHLVPGPTSLMRSEAPDDSPLTPIEERRTRPLRGTIDVHDSPIGAAAVGTLEADISDPPDGILDVGGIFFDPTPLATVALYTGIDHPRTSSIAPVFTRADGGPLPVLMLAHADSFLSFVAVPDVDAQLVTSGDAFVARISASAEMAIQPIDPDAGNAPIGEPCGPINLCPSQDGPHEVTCPQLVRDQGVAYTAYRATYRGTLASSQAPAISFVDGSTSAYRFADPSIASFDDRLVVPGDLLLVQVHNQNCDDLVAPPVEVIATGTVTSVDGDSLVVQFEDVELIPTCPNVPEEELPFRSARYEVYPGDDVMVLARQAGPLVIEVIAREPVVSDVNGSVVEFTDQLAMRISSPVPFSCSSTTAVQCANNLDCGIGRSCVERGELGGCGQTCDEMCDDTDPVNCIRNLVGRACTTVDLEVLPTVPFVLPAGQTQNASVQTFAPAGAVFSRARQTFVISYPGSRILVEVRTSANGQLLIPIR